jgi:hypothetical protein
MTSAVGEPGAATLPNAETPHHRTLTFVDFTDVQTRLVLLPRDEAEGIGAVVSAYYENESPEGQEEEEPCADESIVGWILLDIASQSDILPKSPSWSSDRQPSLPHLDFATILSIIRKQTADTPILLSFANPDSLDASDEKDVMEAISLEDSNSLPVEDAFEEEKKSEDLDCRNTMPNTVEASSEAAVADTTDVIVEPPPPAPEIAANASPLFSSKHLSSWTSRMSSAAASHAAAIARAANERAKVTTARVAAAVVPEFPTAAIVDLPPAGRRMPELHLFVQSEAGTWIPVPEVNAIQARGNDASIPTLLQSPTNKSSSVLTNASYLTVRASVLQAAPTGDEYHYQWYRSSASLDEWDLLPGANTPSLQPSATEIGYRVRCVIARDAADEKDTSESMICETEDIVTASLPILNGSRQALARGAHFGGLQGQGKAEGRTFRVKIVISTDARRQSKDGPSRGNTVAAVTIYQVSGSTSEPFHAEDEPLFCHSAAVTDYGQSKHLALLLDSLPPSASMVAALCSPEGDGMDVSGSGNHPLYFHLRAPNRLARESMILAIGVANFKGKPVELNASSILFHHHDERFCLECDDVSSASSGDSSELLPAALSSDSSLVFPTKGHPTNDVSQERTPLPPTPQRSASLGGTLERHSTTDLALHEELENLRSKLVRKDKVISELQRQLAQSDKTIQETDEKLQSCQSLSQQQQNESNTLRIALAAAEQKVEALTRDAQSGKTEQDARYGALECDLQFHRDRISKLEKENRALQNDKDVLRAAVETRELKLSKMEEMQSLLDDAKVQLSQQSNVQQKVDELNKRYAEARAEIDQMQADKSNYGEEMKNSHEKIASLELSLQAEAAKTASYQSKLEMEQMTVQKLKAERNSYKQKGDSLAKEMSRLCRDGRTVREIEKILADDATRQEEVVVLREQKRKALEQVEHFRTAYEQSLCAQRLAGLDHDAGKLLERNAELERLLTELTEYLNAKEMQLDTMKQVNDALQSEIRDLAKAHMSKNDI